MAGPVEPMTWEAFRALEPAPPGERIDPGEGPRSWGELRLPPGPGPHPVVVVVHGGCWTSMAGPRYLGRLAAALVAMGWATWSVAFRRVDDPGGGWPATLADPGRALDRLRDIADTHPVDPDRVVTLGHSSGGHLALWLAARAMLPQPVRAATGGTDVGGAEDVGALRGPDPLRPIGVVGLAPISDLADFHGLSDRGCRGTAVADLLGADPADVPARLAIADPGARLPLRLPQLLVAAELDDTVPPDHVRRHARRARAAGDAVRDLVVPDAGHFELVDPEHPSWAVHTGPAIRAFLAGVTDAR